MTDNYENKPISTFDEICHVTIETMRKMDLETLLQLKKQATRELDRAKLTKGCIELALSLKAAEIDQAAQQDNDSQPSLFNGSED